MQLILIIEDHLTSGSAASLSSRRRHLIRTDQTLVVGRDPKRADILVESDSAMSGVHFQVSCRPDGCILQDLESRHGTTINGQRAATAELKDADYILAGETRFIVQLINKPPRSTADAGVNTLRVTPRVSRSSEIAASGSTIAHGKTDTAAAAERRMRLQLQILTPTTPDNPAQTSHCFVTLLPGETVTVGRVPERADLCFPADHEMSGAHLELSCGRNDCRLRDLNSTNGTFLNGQQMHNLLLQDGDEIRAGRSYFIVQMEIDPSAPPPAPRQTIADITLGQQIRQQTRQGTGGYRIVNTTPFPLAPLAGQINYPAHSLTLIIKGTFKLRRDEVAVAADEQIFPSGDVPFESDADPKHPVRYESDFAFLKPRADVLLVGHCHAPGQQAVRQLQAGLQVGQRSHWLEVYGKRFWQQERGTWKTTDPEPFTSLNLHYSASFGGSESDRNPVGMGYRRARLWQSEVPLPAPRIVTPEALLRSPDDIVEPAGFGPVGKWYGRRSRQMGTYDKSWQQRRFPWFPEDFSWNHFNAAPEQLQVDGYLRGDEQLTLTNLHPEHAEYRSQLPGIRIRCFINPLGREFCEVPTVLDTLWLDADSQQAVLVWRGHTAVASEECEDLRHIFVLSQPLHETPWSVSECHAMLLDELARRDALFNPPAEKPPEMSSGEQPESAVVADASENSSAKAEETAAAEQNRLFDEEITRLRAKIKETQVAAGFDPDLFDAQVRAEEARLIREWGLDNDVPPVILAERVNAEYSRLKQQIQQAQLAAGQKPEPLPDELLQVPASPESAAEAAESAKGWTRERVIAHHSTGGSFFGEDLTGLNLADLDLSGVDFEAAILIGAKLCRCQLQGARFMLALAAEADFSGAQMQHAILDHADLSSAVLHQTVLDDVHAHGAILAGAWLTGASMQRADAAGSYFTQADLTDAVLSSARLDGAHFGDARMARADLRSCSLVAATLEIATGHKACFDHADLSQVRASGCDFSGTGFRQVQGVGSIWEKAQLKSADFSYAQLQGTNFIKADLEGAILYAADMTGCRLTKARLKDAKMTDMNLFEAGLLQADFTAADISRSNLYGAEVLGANWTETRRDEVNWKMTKLADEMMNRERSK